MIRQLISATLCRLVGRQCELTTPSSRSVREKLQERAREVDAQTTEIRLRRGEHAIIKVFRHEMEEQP